MNKETLQQISKKFRLLEGDILKCLYYSQLEHLREMDNF